MHSRTPVEGGAGHFFGGRSGVDVVESLDREGVDGGRLESPEQLVLRVAVHGLVAERGALQLVADVVAPQVAVLLVRRRGLGSGRLCSAHLRSKVASIMNTRSFFA